jgi:hypothetical protein
MRKTFYLGDFMKCALSFTILALLAIAHIPCGYADEVLVRTPSGKSLTLEIPSHASFHEVMAEIEKEILEEECSQSAPSYFIDYMKSPSAPLQMSARDYSASVSAKEKENISYIVKTLATSSWAQLLKKKDSLKKAGDRVDHVHPLKFLTCIFTDEELKGALHSIRNRGKVWREFFEGLSDSLEEEANRKNMPPEVIQDFADKVGIPVTAIAGLIAEKKWAEFIDALLREIPREGNPGRYDM